MSISYGNFSHALLSTVTSGSATGSSIYFTLPWYPASYVDRIRIQATSGTAPSSYTLSILSNGAHERINDFTTNDEYLYIDSTAKNTSGIAHSAAFWSIDPALFVEDKYARPYLHVKLNLGSNISGAFFTMTAQGRKAISTKYNYADSNGLLKLNDYRVLRSSSAGGTVDVSNFALSNSSVSTSNFAISASTDYIYVGSDKKIDHWDFGVAVGSTNAGVLTGELLTSATWKGFTVLDNTANSPLSSLRFSGTVEGYGIGSSTWLPEVLSVDPLTDLENDIKNGDAYPIGMLYNPPRYWVRFKVASISDTATFKHILPVNDMY